MARELFFRPGHLSAHDPLEAAGVGLDHRGIHRKALAADQSRRFQQQIMREPPLDDYYDRSLTDGDRNKWYERCSQALAKRTSGHAPMADRERCCLSRSVQAFNFET